VSRNVRRISISKIDLTQEEIENKIL